MVNLLDGKSAAATVSSPEKKMMIIMKALTLLRFTKSTQWREIRVEIRAYIKSS